MSIGGMLGHRKNQKPTQKCERCKLRYPQDTEKCMHCGELDEAGLQALLRKIDHQTQSNKKLGFKFLLLAGFLLFGLFLIAR